MFISACYTVVYSVTSCIFALCLSSSVIVHPSTNYMQHFTDKTLLAAKATGAKYYQSIPELTCTVEAIIDLNTMQCICAGSMNDISEFLKNTPLDGICYSFQI